MLTNAINLLQAVAMMSTRHGPYRKKVTSCKSVITENKKIDFKKDRQKPQLHPRQSNRLVKYPSINMINLWKCKQGYSCKNPNYFYGTARVLSTPVIKSNLPTSWTIKCCHTNCSWIEITLPYSFWFLAYCLRYFCALLSTMLCYFRLVRSKLNVYLETKFYTSKSGPIKSRTNVTKTNLVWKYHNFLVFHTVP